MKRTWRNQKVKNSLKKMNIHKGNVILLYFAKNLPYLV